MQKSRAMVLAFLFIPVVGNADDSLFRYEGDVLPLSPEGGWILADPCEPPCAESLENGHFVLTWPVPSNVANYHRTIAIDSVSAPPTLWVEWRFRSNHLIGPSFYTCDAEFFVDYKNGSVGTYLYANAAITGGGAVAVTGLEPDAFHTYRFQSDDGSHYFMAVDGSVFYERTAAPSNQLSYLQFNGIGGCTKDQIPNARNEWDFIRYGTLGTNERVVSTDPPAGYLDPQQYANLDRFAVTFDQPNYLYVNDITVEVTGGGTPPIVTKTWRRENDGPETLEIVLDRSIPIGETTRFTFTDGSTNNIVEYTLAPPPPEPIPTVSEWGLAILAILLLVAGNVTWRRVRPTRATQATR